VLDPIRPIVQVLPGQTFSMKTGTLGVA
jgi:hypothetical protein